MDLTGSWEDRTNTPPFSTGKYDTWNGDQRLDIWVARIKANNLPALGAEDRLVAQYLAKTHDYRTRRLAPHRRALVYADDDWCTTMASEDAQFTASLYGDLLVTSVIDPEATTAADYKTNQMPDHYEFVNLRSHGSPAGHGFYQQGFTVFNFLESAEYRTLTPRALFYSLYVCSGCNFTIPDYLGGTIAFNTNGSGLLCWGSTKTGGIWGDQELFTPLTNGACLGAAFRAWFNQVNEWWPDYTAAWWRGMVILGDASLRLDRTGSGVSNLVLGAAGPLSQWPTIPGGVYYFESATNPPQGGWQRASAVFTAATYTASFTHTGATAIGLLRLTKDETPSGNLLNNRGFELPGPTNREARYWAGNSPDALGGYWGNASRESWRAHDGQWEATVKAPWGGTYENFGGWWREVPAAPGQALTASAWFWADSQWTAAVQQLKIEYFSDTGCLQTNSTSLHGVGPAWTQIVAAGTAPSGTTKAHFTINVEGTSPGGALQIDGAYLGP